MQEKIRIFMDNQIFTIQNFGGISRVFTELYLRFKSGSFSECEIPIIFSENDYLKGILNTHSLFPENKSFLKKLFYYAINRSYSVLRLLRGNFDVFQPTYYDPYFLPFLKNKPFVLVVHDMTHELFPENVSIQDRTIEWKKKLVYKADRIVAISENTKRDIIKFYDIDESKIEVIYWGTSMAVSKEKVEIDLPEKYILFVGNRNTYKNFNLFFKSIIPILKEKQDLNLVCAGSSKFSQEEMEMIQREELVDRVKHIKFKNDKEQAYIYNNAICFVFPSLYEGFGLPVLEAFACDCPVVLSNTSSFPEVGGDAVEYFNPRDTKSIEDSVRRVVENPKLRKEMIQKGKQRLKIFSWDNAAKKFLDIYKTLKL